MTKPKNTKDLYRKVFLDKRGKLLEPKAKELKILFDKNGKPIISIAKVSHIPQKRK